MALNQIEINGRNIDLNHYGYLENYTQWTEDVARFLAADEGFELTTCHWQAIYFIRKYFSRYEIPPSQELLLKEIGNELRSLKCTQQMLGDLFPEGRCDIACRIAGLPDFFFPDQKIETHHKKNGKDI